MREFTAPRAVRRGETVGIFSPSEPLTVSRQERMKPSLELLSRNFKYKFSSNAFAEFNYTAGSEKQRLADIDELLNDETISCLMGSWGGKNANQLISKLPYSTFLEKRKPVIGFSDVCVLLNAITAQTGLITFAGPNIAGKLIESDHWDLGIISGMDEPIFGQTADSNWQTLVSGTARGRLFGGNLTTFTLGLAGSEAMKRMKDVIFFWESASEPPQIIDQHLSCLYNCGFLDNVTGMIIGDVSYKEEPRKERSINDVISEFASRLGIPAVRIETFGHHKMENPAIPIGCLVNLNTDDKLIERLEPVVLSE